MRGELREKKHMRRNTDEETHGEETRAKKYGDETHMTTHDGNNTKEEKLGRNTCEYTMRKKHGGRNT